ncbi:uncharacterized protein LOC142362287 isoform X2 [Opisthocomus hoazin]|uniref:uncharacterized protein LOC142362287 isoform X2 n=1 Tax=Opisthocomus hoazin TaxID=30419 RepID=UPI003F53C5B3
MRPPWLLHQRRACHLRRRGRGEEAKPHDARAKISRAVCAEPLRQPPGSARDGPKSSVEDQELLWRTSSCQESERDALFEKAASAMAHARPWSWQALSLRSLGKELGQGLTSVHHRSSSQIPRLPDTSPRTAPSGPPQQQADTSD